MRFPIIPDNIRKHQNILLNWPLFFSVAHSDKYLPSATQSIAAPKPTIIFPMYKIAITKYQFNRMF